jgi:hypothetical protein
MTLIGIIAILAGAALFVRSLTNTGTAIFGPIGAIVFGIGWLLAGMSFGWIAMVAGAIGFLILAVSNPSTPRQKGIARTLAILGLLVTIPLGALWAWAYSNEEQPASAQTTLPSLAPTTSSTTMAPRTDCKDGHVVKMPDRGPTYRLNNGGVPDEYRNNVEGFRQFIRNQASGDPITLYIYYEQSSLQKVDPLVGPAELVENSTIADGNCYSDKGVRVFNEWAAHWKTAQLEPKAQITHTGGNTGVNGTTPTYSRGVSGSDQSGYDVTYRDANGNVTARHSVLNRCTQPTTPGPPSKQEGPTDNKPPPPGATTSTTRPGVTPTTQPPGSTTTTTRPGGTTTTTAPPGSTTTTTVPTCPNGTPIPPNGLCPKVGEEDPQVNTSIPAEVRGPGTTPVGTDPGPPDAPATHDSTNPDVRDDGYCQSCERPTSPSTTVPTATTVPPVTTPPTTAPPVVVVPPSDPPATQITAPPGR